MGSEFEGRTMEDVQYQNATSDFAASLDLPPLGASELYVNTRREGKLADAIEVKVDAGSSRIKPWWIKSFCERFGEVGAMTKRGEAVAIVEFVHQQDADRAMRELRDGTMLDSGNGIRGKW